jgi:putative transposase
MARPYSMDLRERAVARVQAGENVRMVAQALSISPSSVVKWSQRFRATGSAAAGKMGGHRPRLLVGWHADFLRERIAQGDFTLRGLVAELAGHGLKVDYRTVWTFIRGEGLSFKKNSSAKRARPAGHRPQADALESLSGADRSPAARLHR